MTKIDEHESDQSFVIIGMRGSTDYLRDSTTNRRFWSIAAQRDAAITISSFRDKHDAVPRRTTVTWSKFVEALRKVRRTGCLVANCKHSVCVHKNGGAWSPAVYPLGMPRRKIHVEEVSLLVVDFNHMTDEQLAAALVPFTPYQRLLHATHSDRPAGCMVCTCSCQPGALHGQDCPSRVDRCVRAVVTLSRPVTFDAWPRFWSTAMAQLKQPVDSAYCVNRFYYLPSRPKDASYYFKVHDGILFDVDAILAENAAPLR